MDRNQTSPEIKFPSFSGNFEDYFDFQKWFKDLVEYIGLVEYSELVYLKENLPAHLASEIAGISDAKSAWEALDE